MRDKEIAQGDAQVNPLHRAAWSRRNPLADKTVFQLAKLAKRGNVAAVLEMDARLAKKPTSGLLPEHERKYGAT